MSVPAWCGGTDCDAYTEEMGCICPLATNHERSAMNEFGTPGTRPSQPHICECGQYISVHDDRYCTPTPEDVPCEPWPYSITPRSLPTIEAVARAMWTATHVNPMLPVPLPFDELTEHTRDVLFAMAQTAIDVILQDDQP